MVGSYATVWLQAVLYRQYDWLYLLQLGLMGDCVERGGYGCGDVRYLVPM